MGYPHFLLYEIFKNKNKIYLLNNQIVNTTI